MGCSASCKSCSGQDYYAAVDIQNEGGEEDSENDDADPAELFKVQSSGKFDVNRSCASPSP